MRKRKERETTSTLAIRGEMRVVLWYTSCDVVRPSNKQATQSQLLRASAYLPAPIGRHHGINDPSLLTAELVGVLHLGTPQLRRQGTAPKLVPRPVPSLALARLDQSIGQLEVTGQSGPRGPAYTVAARLARPAAQRLSWQGSEAVVALKEEDRAYQSNESDGAIAGWMSKGVVSERADGRG